MDRRSLLKSGLLALAAPQIALPPWIERAAAQGASPSWRHGIAKFGALRYSAGFKQFDYVNAAAPKGGSASAIALGTFDNFNSAVTGVKGTLAFGIELIHNTLLVSSLDEVASVYGLLAEVVSYPDNYASATYRLRAEAKWNDGKPVTPEDVVFSFESFKKLSPMSAASFRHVV
jgi:microcin C transport system substrate-binding protein